jgi:hypothetical protein
MVTRAKYGWLLAGGALALFVGLAGFGVYGRAEATREARAAWRNYQKVEVGMVLTEVLTILGAPSGTLGSETSPGLYWQVDGQRQIVIWINARGCSVAAKEWMDGGALQRLERRLLW